MACAGAFTAYKTLKRLSRHQAASWLDEQTQTVGLFRAASECLDQEPLGPAQKRVLAEADRRLSEFAGQPGIAMPWRRLLLRSGLAVLGTAACLVLLGFVTPPPLLRPSQTLEDSPTARPGEMPPVSDPAATESQELSTKEAARRLYPEDARLAALAEQALTTGDPAALEALLEQSAEAAEQAARSSTEKGPGQSGGAQPQEEASPTKEPRPPSPRDQGQGAPGAASGDHQSSAPKGEQGEAGEGAGGNPDPDFRDGSQGNPGSGNPGTGSSDKALGPRKVLPPTDKRVAINEQKNPGLFEYVLPGAGAKVPTAQTLADSRRSAEAVISRTNPPLEFENTIRDYFLSLSQEVSP